VTLKTRQNFVDLAKNSFSSRKFSLYLQP